ILGLLVAIVSPPVLRYLSKTKTDAARLQIHNIGLVLEDMKREIGRYPTTQEGLQALIDAPAGVTDWHGPYITQKRLPLDPWNRPYIYRSPGEHGEYDLYTLGADNLPGGTGENQDVTNW